MNWASAAKRCLFRLFISSKLVLFQANWWGPSPFLGFLPRLLISKNKLMRAAVPLFIVVVALFFAQACFISSKLTTGRPLAAACHRWGNELDTRRQANPLLCCVAVYITQQAWSMTIDQREWPNFRGKLSQFTGWNDIHSSCVVCLFWHFWFCAYQQIPVSIQSLLVQTLRGRAAGEGLRMSRVETANFPPKCSKHRAQASYKFEALNREQSSIRNMDNQTMY